MKDFDEGELWMDFFGLAWRVAVVVIVIGVIVLAVTGVLGQLANQVTNDLFNTSQQHTGAVAQRFSDDCLQLSQATSNQERKAIENDIYQVASTVNLNNVNMTDETRTCVNRAIYDIANNKFGK